MSPFATQVDPAPRLVDYHAVKTGQAFLILGLLLAFLLKNGWLVAFVAAVMLLSAFAPWASLPTLFYAHVLKHYGIVKPDVRADNPEPHRFSQMIGGSSALLAAAALVAGADALGWSICWVVMALASLNLFAGICVGAIFYYQLQRLGVPGFDRAPLETERPTRLSRRKPSRRTG